MKYMTLDGQKIVLPESLEWTTLLDGHGLCGVKLALGTDSAFMPSWLFLLEFCETRGDFVLGLVATGNPTDEECLPLVLYITGDNYVRVHIERLTCSHCDWSGYSANPLISDLFLGTKDKDTDMPNSTEVRRTTPIPERQRCPNCNGELPRYAAWVERSH